jgi:glutathione S-transferase
VLSFSKDGEVLPKSINTSLEAKAPNFWKWASNLVKQESVTYIYDEKKIVEKAKVRFANLRKQAAAAK